VCCMLGISLYITVGEYLTAAFRNLGGAVIRGAWHHARSARRAGFESEPDSRCAQHARCERQCEHPASRGRAAHAADRTRGWWGRLMSASPSRSGDRGAARERGDGRASIATASGCNARATAGLDVNEDLSAATRS